MFLNQLINPKPRIIILFIVFCVIISLSPLVLGDLDLIYSKSIFSPFFVLLLSLLIPSFHAIGLNNMIYEKNIIKKDNLVIGFVYLLLSVPFYNCLNYWIVSFFILFYINYLFDGYQKDFPLSQTFNASFIISLLSFIDPNILLLVPLIIISTINYDNMSWRVFLNIVIGLVIPYFFYYVYSEINQSAFFTPNIQLSNMPLVDYKNWSGIKVFWLLYVTLICLLSFAELFKWLYKKSIRSRKSFIIILFYFILTFVVGAYGDESPSFYYLISPLSIIVGNYFTYSKKRRLANGLFLILIISSMYYRCFIAI